MGPEHWEESIEQAKAMHQNMRAEVARCSRAIKAAKSLVTELTQARQAMKLSADLWAELVKSTQEEIAADEQDPADWWKEQS